jgi:hypothetical protein
MIMQPDQAANTLRLALTQIEKTGAVSGPVLTDLKALVRDLEGKDMQLDYAQRKVTIHALECLLDECRNGPKSYRDHAQYIVNQCPPRRKKGETDRQSVEIVIGEALDLLR